MFWIWHCHWRHRDRFSKIRASHLRMYYLHFLSYAWTGGQQICLIAADYRFGAVNLPQTVFQPRPGKSENLGLATATRAKTLAFCRPGTGIARGETMYYHLNLPYNTVSD